MHACLCVPAVLPGHRKSLLEHTSRVHTFAFTRHYKITFYAMRQLTSSPTPYLHVYGQVFFFFQLSTKLC